MEIKWIHFAGLLWECPKCKRLTISSEEHLTECHKYCGVCGNKNIKEDKDEDKS